MVPGTEKISCRPMKHVLFPMDCNMYATLTVVKEKAVKITGNTLLKEDKYR